MEFWEKYRREFPVTEHWAYMNHAAVAPLSRRAADAMQGTIEDVCRNGVAHSKQWDEVFEGLRSSAARLIGASAEEIAIVKNTTEGLAIVANGLDWRPGDAMAAVEREFPANYYPWKHLETRGVKVRWIPQREGRIELEDVDRACAGARLLTISFVQYLSGFRVDLEEVGKICARHGCLYVVDAIQGLGVFPVDVRKAGIHALAADGHKWLMGPEGCAILFVASNLIPRIEPVEFGWTSVANYRDYQSRDAALRAGAARYECGTLNTAGCYGMLAAIDLLLEVGIERIGARVASLSRRIAAGVASRGYRLMTSPEGEATSGILAFQKEGLDTVAAVKRLASQRIAVAPRSGWIRTSPHFYVSDEEVDRLLAALPA
ncbi:MAG: aminotransferase class V-fold PLP-dependent enzyme [Acidobacteria bacterium]|nr:aminotransferase class V-fold PLP-dependent enzyme [Acidobacteriota bacterium]